MHLAGTEYRLGLERIRPSRYCGLLMQSLPRRTNGNEIVKSFRRIRDDANRVFNYSEWLGTARAVALRNVHHPGNQRGVAAARLAG
jgi:hypothetical protein